MVAMQKDFIQEQTLLQYHAQQIGATVLCTPKCHCELAGEGIEYHWGFAKQFYRKLPMKEKKGKDNFHKSVRKSMAQLDVELARKFSQRARSYMVAYHYLDNREEENADEMTMLLIEKVVKSFKTHRCASDVDAGYLRKIWKKMRSQHQADPNTPK